MGTVTHTLIALTLGTGCPAQEGEQGWYFLVGVTEDFGLDATGALESQPPPSAPPHSLYLCQTF